MTRLPLLEQALHGGNRQLTLLAAQGVLPVPPAELIGAQVELTFHGDEEIADAARRSLSGVGHEVLVPLLLEGAAEAVVSYFGLNSSDPRVIEAVLRRRDVPPSLLLELAPRLTPDLQEVLLLRQDRIIADPGILVALEGNPALSLFSRRRIGEYRQHLLAAGRVDRAEAEEEAAADGAEDALTEAEIAAALAQARQQPTEGEVEEITGLSEGQIRTLPIPVRLKLARGAPLTLRNLLIRDNNPRVALAVLQGNSLADQEVEGVAKSRAVVVDVLEAIARERRWMSKYAIALALACNARTPLAISTKLVPRLSVRDLRNLSRDRNVPDAVRTMAQRLYRIKLQ